MVDWEGSHACEIEVGVVLVSQFVLSVCFYLDLEVSLLEQHL